MAIARIEPSDEVLVACSARDGTTASDGTANSRNSPLKRLGVHSSRISEYRKHARKAAETLLSSADRSFDLIMLPGQRRDELRWIASSMVAIRRAFAAAYRRCEQA